ncbi:ribosome maturation factor RimP [Campylobacter sp.]|uniref:ribosome maturation factor RimP n=1 Tax=Campylobacter sp. TaxID=205 RepID=UPI0027028A1E|nr:ribosome maturation factor RimP [Campylobacter sp.]
MQNLEKLIKECGVDLYDTEVANENGRTIYRIYITKAGGVSLDECEKVSRLLSPIFDVEPPLNGDYTLEVSSPGLERKLEKPNQFILSIGELVKISALIDGETKKLKGKLIGASNDEIELECEDQKLKIKISDIKKAKTYFEW